MNLQVEAMFPRVNREPRLSDKVAELLLSTIMARGLQPGERLPSERELGQQFGVSRTVIREAVRALAAKGVIDVRTGSGLRVAAVDASAVSESMRLFLHGSGALDYGKVHEVRAMIENEVAGLAAERATDEDVERLTEICERMAGTLDDVEQASHHDVEFHRAVAECTHNELYVIMLDSIGDVLLEIRRATLGLDGRPSKGLKAHRKILDRIAAHDPAGAREAMREHLRDSQRAWRKIGWLVANAPVRR
jgi:GntR family transcriptional repressor for pyruvate dehydrogenase complex